MFLLLGTTLYSTERSSYYFLLLPAQFFSHFSGKKKIALCRRLWEPQRREHAQGPCSRMSDEPEILATPEKEEEKPEAPQTEGNARALVDKKKYNMFNAFLPVAPVANSGDSTPQAEPEKKDNDTPSIDTPPRAGSGTKPPRKRLDFDGKPAPSSRYVMD